MLDKTSPPQHLSHTMGGSTPDMPEALSLLDMQSLEQRLMRLHRQSLPLIADPLQDSSFLAPTPMHEAETVAALAESAGSWAPPVWRIMGLPTAGAHVATPILHVGGADRQLEDGAQLQLCAWSCAELMASLLAGHPSVTPLLAQDIEEGRALVGMRGALAATSSNGPPTPPPSPAAIAAAIAAMQAWALVTRLLGSAFVGLPKTGQLMLDLMKPAFSPSQNDDVKARGYRAWVQMADSMACSGCVHKASRYKLLLQPLRHALLYDSSAAIREAAMRAWVGVVSALGEDRPLGRAGSDPAYIAAPAAADAEPSPRPGEEGGQAVVASGTCPTPGVLALLTPSPAGPQHPAGLASLLPTIPRSAGGTPQFAAEIQHQFSAHSGATFNALSLPPEAWTLVVDPVLKLVLGTEAQLPRGRVAHQPVQRSLLLLLLPLLQRLCVGDGGRGSVSKVSEPHLGAILAALHTALDAGDKQSGGTAAMTHPSASSAAASSFSAAVLSPPGLVAEPWSPSEAACWSDLLVAMFSALLPAGNGQPGGGDGGAAVAVDGVPMAGGVRDEAASRRSELIVLFGRLVVRLMCNLAAAPPASSPPPSDKGAASRSGGRDESESSLPLGELGASASMHFSPQQSQQQRQQQQQRDRDGVTASWAHFVHAACRINALAAECVSSSSSSSSLSSPGTLLDTVTLTLSILQIILVKAGPERLHAMPPSHSDAAAAVGSGAVGGSLPSLSLWGELARSWLGMLGKCGVLAGNAEWREGLSSVVKGAGQGTANFSRFNVLLSLAGALPLRPHGSLCVWMALSSGLRGCMEPILKDCSGRPRRVAAAGAAVDVLLYCIRALAEAAGRSHSDDSSGSGNGSCLEAADAVLMCSEAADVWCRCFSMLVEATRRWSVPDQSVVPLLAVPRGLLQAVAPLLTSVSSKSHGPPLLAISVIASRLCQWLSGIADYASSPGGDEAAKAPAGTAAAAAVAAAASPLGKGLSLTPSRMLQASTPLSTCEGTGVGSDIRRRDRGGGSGTNGASPASGEVAPLAAEALQQGCQVAGLLLLTSLRRIPKQGSGDGGGSPLAEALRGPCMQAVVESARAMVTMAGGGGSPAAVPLALGTEVMCGLLAARIGADEGGDGVVPGNGAWGDAMTFAIEEVLPRLAAAFPDEVEAALTSGDRGSGGEWTAPPGGGRRGKAGGRGRAGRGAGGGGSKGGGRGGGDSEHGGPGQTASELLDAWMACLDAVLALRNHGGRDVQGCVDALQGALVAAVRCGIPAIRNAAYSFARAACAEGALGGGGTTRSAASKRSPGPAATLPQLVQSAMDDDEADPPDSLPDGLFGTDWQKGGTAMLPPPLATGGWTRSKELQRQQQAAGGVGGDGGTAIAVRQGSVTPPPLPPATGSTAGTSKKRSARSGPFCASQTEYVAIPRQPGPPPSAPPSGRTRRQQWLCTYTNLDASQAPRDAIDEPSQQQGALIDQSQRQWGGLVDQSRPLVDGEGGEVAVDDDVVQDGRILDPARPGAASGDGGGVAEDELPPEVEDSHDDINAEEVGPVADEPPVEREEEHRAEATGIGPDDNDGAASGKVPPSPPQQQQQLPMVQLHAVRPFGARSHLPCWGSSECAAEPPPPPPSLAAPGVTCNSQPWSGLEVESTQQLYSEVQASRGRAGKQQLQLLVPHGLLVPPHAAQAMTPPLQQQPPAGAVPPLQQQQPPAGAVVVAGMAVPGGQLKRGLEGGDVGGGGDAREKSHELPPGAKRRAMGVGVPELAAAGGGGASSALVAGDGGGGRTRHAAGQLLNDLQGLAVCPTPFWDDMEVPDILVAQRALMELLQTSHASIGRRF